MDEQLRIFDRLLEVSMLIQHDLERSFAGTGLTAARTHLLWELHRLGPSNQRTLAEALQVSPRNVTGLVDALEAGGFVTRSAFPGDRRALQVSLTAHGAETVEQMERDRVTMAAQLVSGLSAQQRTGLARSLDSVVAELEALVSR